jgi:S-adenosylmethionine:tRNA ribosyltransferase-isomerase
MELYTSDFTYNLPQARIALFPEAERDGSKLLFYNQGDIQHHMFRNIAELIQAGTMLVFNNSKVIPARFHFTTSTGATIEVFLLHPADRAQSAHELMQQTSPVRWVCTIGNKKRWKAGSILQAAQGGITVEACLIDEVSNVIEFHFTPGRVWAEVVSTLGDTPLPPYIKRKAQQTDNERYQTVYSSVQGAVAAPTAGLHFTPEILDKLTRQGIATEYLTLHVGAGTFLPIKSEVATEHRMHEESLFFTKENIQHLLNHHQSIIAVGTTSCRILESLYWYGVKLLTEGDVPFEIGQHYAAQFRGVLPTRSESLQKIYDSMSQKRADVVMGHTAIYIYPGYRFKLMDGLITNFHQPNSTLLLLIAALVGNDWRAIYDSALTNNYRFLSYGDSSLLIPKAS